MLFTLPPGKRITTDPLGITIDPAQSVSILSLLMLGCNIPKNEDVAECLSLTAESCFDLTIKAGEGIGWSDRN